jgi:hypothetical protein
MSLYQPLIPTGTVDLDVDYQNLQNNFQQLDTSFGVDHLPFSNQTAQNGYHKNVHLVPNAASVATPGYGQVFNATLNDGINTDQILFFLTGGNRLMQLTRNFAPVAGTNGYTFLPGGFIMQWGRATTASGATITFPQAFPSAVYSIQCTVVQNTTNRHFVYVRSQNTTGFVTTQLDSGGIAETSTFSWTAIGV